MRGRIAAEVSSMRFWLPRLIANRLGAYPLTWHRLQPSRSYGKSLPGRKIGRWGVAVTILCAAAAFGTLTSQCARTAERPLNIVALGDSLTAGFGLRVSEAFP